MNTNDKDENSPPDDAAGEPVNAAPEEPKVETTEEPKIETTEAPTPDQDAVEEQAAPAPAPEPEADAPPAPADPAPADPAPADPAPADPAPIVADAHEDAPLPPSDEQQPGAPDDDPSPQETPNPEPSSSEEATEAASGPSDDEAADAAAPDAQEEAADEGAAPPPLRIYEYRYVRVRQNTWAETAQAILGSGAAAVAEAGGQLFGVWAGQIGLSANQGVVVTVWPDLAAAKKAGKAAIAGLNSVTASETLYLEPTTRPVECTAPEGPGMFAHRVFEVRRDDTERFVGLSDEAWPQFEEVFGAKIFALWREVGHERAMDRLILLTRYPDYAAWEASRYWRPEPNPNASDALQRFRDRREITVDTVVYSTALVTSDAG